MCSFGGSVCDFTGVPLKFPRIVQFLSHRVFSFFLLSVFNVLTCLGAIDNHDFHTAFAQTLLSFQHLFHRFAVMELWVQLGDATSFVRRQTWYGRS